MVPLHRDELRYLHAGAKTVITFLCSIRPHGIRPAGFFYVFMSTSRNHFCVRRCDKRHSTQHSWFVLLSLRLRAPLMPQACRAHHVSAVRHHSAVAADPKRTFSQLPCSQLGANALIVMALTVARPRSHWQSSICHFSGVFLMHPTRPPPRELSRHRFHIGFRTALFAAVLGLLPITIAIAANG